MTGERAHLLTDADRIRLETELAEVVERMVAYVLRTADCTRSDRLWPADFMVFATNSLSVAHGACGPVLFLHDAGRDLPADVVAWLLEQPVSVETHPPGLYMGLAGIAWTFLQIGLTDKAEAVMATAYRSPLLYDDPGILLGAAGWGLASLRFWMATGRQVYLDRAMQAGEHLLATGQREGDTRRWRCGMDQKIHYGYGYGASGIALFLLYLGAVTGRADLREGAIQGLEFDLANKSDSEVGWQWKRLEDDTVLYPYWIHGSAGIGSTLVRFARLLGADRYRALADRIAEDTFVKYSFIPSLFDGLAGIGELMVDMWSLTADEAYREYAFDIADTMLWFKIDRPEGVAYPGGWLTRISNDYATGAAGIGLYFTRLLRPRGRLFMDLDLGPLGGRG